MALTAPYEQKNYMGEFADDTACGTDIAARGWDSGGNPINGMWYYNTTAHEFRGYINGAWAAFGDDDAIHDNVAAEISVIAEETSPAGDDVLLLEDQSDSYNKKRIQISNLLSESLIDHDLLANFVANEHIDWTSASDNLLTTGSITGDGFEIDATSSHTITDNSDVLEVTNPNGDGEVKIVLPVTGDPGDTGYGPNSITFSKYDVEVVPDLWFAWNAITPETGRTLLLETDAVYIGKTSGSSPHKYIYFMDAAGISSFGSIHAYETSDTITLSGFSGGFTLTGTDLKFQQSTLGVYFGTGGDDGYIIETHTAYADYRMQLYHDEGVWEFMTDADNDLEFRFLGTTNSGLLKWMEDEDYFLFSDDILVDSTERIYFRDTAIHVCSLTDGHLDLTADVSVDMNADLDISTQNIVTDTTTGTKIATATDQKIGLWNATPVVQPTALTAKLTDLSGDVAPSTPDYALTATNNGWGCGSQDEFETMTSVILNLQTRVSELETKLQSIGLLA